MKYTKKDYAKFNIDLSKCETYDDVVICTVEGNINNGAPMISTCLHSIVTLQRMMLLTTS